jgi:hypothetical protein
MKATEIIKEDAASGKYTNINAEVRLDGMYFSQNIPTIQTRESSEIEFMLYNLKKKAPDAAEGFKTFKAQVNSQITHTLAQLTDAYYATAHAVLSTAKDDLVAQATNLLNQNGITRNDPL